MIKIAALTLLTLISTASLAWESQVTMSCGAPHAKDGTPIVGVGYSLLINYGFDTHARNDQGGFGQAFATADLISTVVAPSAQPRTERLTLRKTTSTNYYFANDQVKATISKSFAAASVIFVDSKAIADCKKN